VYQLIDDGFSARGPGHCVDKVGRWLTIRNPFANPRKMSNESRTPSGEQRRLDRLVSARQRQIRELADQNIKSHIDQLTGGVWKGTYEDSLYDDPELGLHDYGMDAEKIDLEFTRRGKENSTFIVDRIINYDGKAYPERFIGSVAPSGKIVANSLADTDILLGKLHSKSGTLSLLFFDDGGASSSLDSQTAVGTFIFNDISKLYRSLPPW
jgi:hypothetical protein